MTTMLTSLCAADFPTGEVTGLRAGVPVSRQAFLVQVQRWRDTLAMRPGSACALHFPDTVEFASAMLGAWQAGKCVLLPGDVQPATLAWLQPLAEAFVGDFPLPGAVTRSDDGARPMRPATPQPDTPAVVVFTSGSTGRPVAAAKTFRQLDGEVRALHAVWGALAGTVPVLASVPHQHFYGLLFKVLWPLSRRAPFVSETLALPHEVTAWLQRRPGVWVASPTILTRLAPSPAWQAARGQLRAVFSSGGPLSLPAALRCAGLLGQGVQEIYGSSETGGVGRRCRIECDAPWQPMPGVSVGIAEDGRLHLRSPWLPDGQEWPTADLAEVHQDGTFSLLGRADRIVKVGEKRVSLAAIEARLVSSPLVREARAVLLPEGRVGAAVVLGAKGLELLGRAGRRQVVRELTALLRSHVVVVALPRRWRFIDGLPENAMGKVVDSALQALFAGG
jgi:acyl-coenzyme A synthetase/AMP-(fatty) acid ligase